jgi:Mg/Co/Ni transporter MgtE
MDSDKSARMFRSVISLRETLFLGFCAALIIVSKMAFRWRLGITGHAMFFSVFFLLIASGTVRNRFSASLTGVMVGLMSFMLGMGRSGPLLIVRYLLPGMAIDLSGMIFKEMPFRYHWCLLAGILAGSTSFIVTGLMDWLVGIDTVVLLQHAGMNSLGNMLFGGLGSVFVPPVMRKLRVHGVLD